MKKEYIVNRQGKDFVLYQGLLAEAHEQGLKRTTVTLIQVPSEDNGQTAIAMAEVETDRGTFSDVGDASPTNVGRMIIPHIIRMASTRAKARALRDAVNIGETSLEELGDLSMDDGGDGDPNYSTGQSGSSSTGDSTPKASPYKPASANQIATIAKLSRLLGAPEEPSEDMTSAEASDRITELSRAYNESKGIRPSKEKNP